MPVFLMQPLLEGGSGDVFVVFRGGWFFLFFFFLSI